MDLDAEWNRWGRMLRGGHANIWEDVLAMVATRNVWQRYSEIVQAGDPQVRSKGTFHTWVTQNYVRNQGLAIRRQTDLREDVVSLARLLHRIARYPQALSRVHHAGLYGPGDQAMAREHWVQLAGADREFIDPIVPAADLESLLAMAEPIRKWVDKELAHYDPNRGKFARGLGIATLHDAVDRIFDLANVYTQRILSVSTARDMLMAAGWDKIFRVPWIASDQSSNKNDSIDANGS